MNRKLCIWLTLLLVATGFAPAAWGAASSCKAPSLQPDPGARYMDMDAAAHADRYVDMTDAVSASALNRPLAVTPHDPRLLVARGYSNAQAHLTAAAERDFRAALAQAPNDEHVHLSYGRALLEMGDEACAIRQWQKAAALHGGHPAWLPQAMAEAYWRLGRHQLALRWYDAAVRSHPERWGSLVSIRAVTASRDFSDNRRDMLQTIYTNWKQQSSRTDVASR